MRVTTLWTLEAELRVEISSYKAWPLVHQSGKQRLEKCRNPVQRRVFIFYCLYLFCLERKVSVSCSIEDRQTAAVSEDSGDDIILFVTD